MLYIFSVKGMLASDVIGLLIMSSIFCVFLSGCLMYDIEIKFDMIYDLNVCV